ncbi:IQ domain-containing protein N [Peromyscus californicus insignis]|uniref:IQ domain-containing protein N n=1 Tax=Peromyscus californicus insignis TaxID=564181 RepID=UPI0022A67B9F|nr:IQ domain-containing protein N [Peromyscus californicus insignis]XP_052608567.1 IQ domain-containing protein N [Peromyscus californicus insignis]
MAAMQPATPLQLPHLASPGGPCLSQPQQTPAHPEKAAKPYPQPQSDSCPPKEPAAPPSQQVPRLRAVVESQAFKNILVDEMDMMVSRAATVIQANWKGYRLRQKLISQMTAAKAIQEAWRRFSTRRLMRSNKLTLKKAKREEEGDIPYHPPQQVRFHAPEDQPPVMVSKETQFPSNDSLVPSHTTAAPGPCISRVHRGGLLPQQPVTGRPTGPKYPPCMLTKTVRSSCLIRHLEGDSVKSRHVASKTIRLGTPESAAAGRCIQAIHGSMKTQTHVHTEACVPKAPPHTYPVNKTPTKVCPVAPAPKSPATVATAPKSVLQTCPTSPATVMKMQTCPTSPATTVMKNLPVTCPTSQVTRPLAHVRPNPSFSSTTPHMRPVVPTARVQPPGCAVTSTIKASPRPRVPISKFPLQTGPGPMMAKTSPQMRPVTRSQPQPCAASTSSKTSTQASSTVKASPQTRLAAMITKTPAQIRSVAAVLRTLCLVPTVAASSPRGSLQTPVVAGIPNTPSQVHLNSQNTKVTVSTKQTTAVVKVASQSYLDEEKGRCGPHGHLDFVAPKPPAKSPLEAEKMKPGPPRVPKKEAAPKTNATIVTRALSWTKVTEDRSKPLTQIQQKAEVVKIHSKVYMPEEMTVTLSQAQLAVPLTKASSQVQPPTSHPRAPPSSPVSKAVSQSHPISGLATGLLEGRRPPVGPSATLSSPLAAHLMSLTAQLQPASEQTRSVSRAHPAASCSATASPKARSPGMTFVPPEGYPNTCPLTPTSQHHMTSHPTKSSPQLRLPAEHSKTTNTKPAKATCQVCPPTKLSKAPSLAHLITCLAKVPSQAHLPMGLAKTQPQAQLASETAKCLLAAHPATDLSSKTQSQPLLGTTKTPVQFWQHFGTLNTGPRAKPDDRNMTQPQLHSHAQNKATQNPRSVATDIQGMLVPLLTPTGHPVCNAESWGDSGQAQCPAPPPVPSQATPCHEDLAASIASLCADLVAMLGSPEDLRTLLAKTLSQGEVRTALSQALSREVLGPSVVKALPQGMLGMALMKVLSWGELGITLSRALSRGELRPELSKATQGKLAEVLCKALTEDERAALSQALCQGELGAVFTQSLAQMAQRTGAFLPKATSKMVGSRMTTAPAPVEVTCSGSLSVAWGPALGPVRARCSKVRLPWEGLPWGQPDGILWGKGDGATLEGSPCSPESPIGSFSGGRVTSTYQCPLLKVPTLSWERGSGLCSGLYLKPLDFDPMACGEGPHVPKRSSQQPPPCPWQPLVANGAGPSSNQPSVTSSTAPSSRQQPLASRVPHPWASYREGNMEASKHSSGVGSGKYPMSQQPTASQGGVCQCPNLGAHKMSPCGHCSSIVKSRTPSPKQNVRQVLPLGHRLANKEIVTVVRNIVDEQHSGQSSSVYLNPKLQKVSSTPTPKQERHPQVSLTPSHPQGQATGHHISLLDELLAAFPQHPKIVLAKSYPRGSVVHSQNGDSHSSLQSGTSASASTPSSLTPSEVLDGRGEDDLQDSQPVLKRSREVRHRPQGLLERTWPAGSQHTVPQFQRPPLDLGPLLFQSTSLNVHWDSDSGSDYSTGDLSEGLSQDTTAPWRGRSHQIHARDLQLRGVPQLDPTLPQDILADGRAPSPGPAPKASEVSPCLSQPLEATGLCPISSQPAGSSTMSPSLTQPSTDTGVAPSLAHPSVATRVFPTLAQPSMDTGVSPTLMEPLMYYGLPTNFSQPFLYYRGSPIYTQPHMASEVPSNFTQTSGANVVALGKQPVSPGLASSQPQLCATTHVAARAAQSPDNSWPPDGSSSMPRHGTGHPDSIQTSVATGVSPDFFHPFVPCSMPSNFTQPCVATIVTSNFVQPPMPHSMSPSLAQPFVVSVMSPTLAHASVANRAPPNLGQPTTASGVVPGVLQVPLANRVSPSLRSPLLAPRVCSNLTQASVASLGTLSLLPPTVVCGVGRGSSKPAFGPQQHAHQDSSTVQSQHSMLHLGGSCPCAMSRLGQPSLGVCGSPGDRLMTGTRSQPSPRDPTVYSELTQASKGPPGPVAQSMAPAEDGGLTLGASVPCQTWFRGIAPGMSQGPVATRLFLSMRQGDNPPPMAAWALPVDAPWTHEQAVVTAGVGQGPCPAVMPSMQVPSEFFPNQLGTSFPQTCASLPVTLDPQLLSMATMVPPSCQYAGMVIPDAALGAVGGGLAQNSVNGKVPSALAPKPVVENLNLFQGSVIRGVGKSVPPESMVDGVAQSVPPESMVDGVAQSVPPESIVDGVAQSVPPESMVDDVAQSVPPESMVDGVAQSVPPESMVDGMAQSVPPESMVDGVAQSVPPESMVDGVAQSVPPESMVDGVAQSVPPESMVDGVAQSVPPESMVGGVAQSVPPESMVGGKAQSFPPEFIVDGVAQSVPPESMVCVKAQNLPPESVVSDEVESSHQDSVASDMALSLPPCSVASGVAPCHPQEMDGRREKLSPAVEPLPSSHPLGPHLGFVASGTVPSMPLGAVASGVAPGSMLVGISPRPYQAAQSGEHSRVSFLAPHVTSLASAHSPAPAVQRVSQDQQRLPTVLSSTSQFSSDPGLTKLVGVDNPTLLKPRQIHNTVSSTLEPGIDPVKSEGLKIISWTGLGATGGECHERETLAAENILKDQVALLAEEASRRARGITLVPVQAPSLGEHPTAHSISPVQPLPSESPASGTPSLQEAPVADRSSQPPASNAVMGPPQLSPNTDGPAKLPPGSEVSTGSPSILQSSGRTDSAPLTKNRTPRFSQTGEPQNHTKSNHREPLTAKNSHRSIQSSLVSELLEGSMDRLLPFSSPLKKKSQVSLDSHKRSSGTPMVGITPVIHVGDGRGQKTASGVQGVSLARESSPNGSQTPLLGEAAHDTRHTGQPRTMLTLTTHPGQRPPCVTGPGVSYDEGSLVPTTTHDQNVQYVTSPETGYDGTSQIPTAPHSHQHQHVTAPKTSFDEGPQRVPTMLYGHRLQYITMPKTSLDGSSQVPTTPHLVTHPKTGHNKIFPPPTVPQGPVDAGPAAGQSWNSKVPNVSVRATAHAEAPRGTWHPSRGPRPWEPPGAEAALDHKPSAELLVSVRAMEKVVVQAIITIQACARGYLVRRTVKVWHQWATIIQATWRGYRVRRNLARLLRATTIIQAAWRGYCTRRARAHQVLLPTMWPGHSGRAQGNSDTRNSSEHRCFLSCQPDVCSLCQALGPRAESPPSVVMLVGSQPRTCHVCGHTLSTRVVQGFGQGVSVQSGSRWASVPRPHPLLSQQHRAATLIQAAWKGYRTRRQISQQQSAAKTVQATWRGHYTRSCLTTDALLGTGSPWANSRDTSRRTSRAYSLHWPGV